MDTETNKVIARLFSSVTMPDDCWEWQGAKSEFGHGRFKVDGSLVSPHRFVYEIFNKPLNQGELVLHRCDNPSCVNPRHLFAGTNSDNMKDCAAKGRLAVQRDPSPVQGERRPNAKLTDDSVREIRKAAADGAAIKDLAITYGVNRSIVARVIKGTRWKHVL